MPQKWGSMHAHLPTSVTVTDSLSENAPWEGAHRATVLWYDRVCVLRSVGADAAKGGMPVCIMDRPKVECCLGGSAKHDRILERSLERDARV